MATPAAQPRLIRTELVMRKQDDNNTLRPVQLPNSLKLPKLNTCSPAPMTEQEAEVFFAICENPLSIPIEMFSNINKVSKWFND